ncbi:hypothetical protein [Jiangella alba]|uniref:Uncharacterized protein n=1 Tax=Jiangella alba TaxID=561176 RepID=A0A1H5PMK2_9ACTN|nr:hypothetical protein [Jiangella alba]SEF14929.1 hypothetical protein SAMN04488561_4785 [Jiangella alba]
MSRAPSTLGGIEEEIRLLRESQRALQDAVAAAVRGRDATAADLTAVQQRITAKTGQALPCDAAIRERIGSAIESSFTTASRALNARWDEIVKLLKEAGKGVAAALHNAEHRQRQREEAEQQARQAQHRTA